MKHYPGMHVGEKCQMNVRSIAVQTDATRLMLYKHFIV